ncbi:MAG TPA: hypothetical protein VFC78_19250 [Tepidisphaeraceae bacterium]|nr:hypothetical protein [Tepidisphaeraceae bacterium]
MLSKTIMKWIAAGALALSVPAVGLARHTSHVSAAPGLISLSATSVATPVRAVSSHAKRVKATRTRSSLARSHRLTSHSRKLTHRSRLSHSRKLRSRKTTSHRAVSRQGARKSTKLAVKRAQ